MSWPETCCHELVCELHFVHHRHEDDAVGVRLGNAFPNEVVENRREVLFDRGQQLYGGETRIDVEFGIEHSSADAFSRCWIRLSRGGLCSDRRPKRRPPCGVAQGFRLVEEFSRGGVHIRFGVGAGTSVKKNVEKVEGKVP